MTFSWFPGHMAKGLRQIEEDLRWVDLVLLLLDARIPRSSRHPQLESMMARRHKGMVMVLNKVDLADGEATRAWMKHFSQQGLAAVAISTASGHGLPALRKLVTAEQARILARAQSKGRVGAATRILVAGIPNVGKSSLINRLTQSSRAKTGKQPGVTKGRHWIALPGGLELRDSPGILFPRIDGRDMFLHLAATGAIREDNLPLEEVGEDLCRLLHRRGQVSVADLSDLARSQGMLRPGALPDVERAAHFLLRQTREARYGPMTLEMPQEPTVEEVE